MSLMYFYWSCNHKYGWPPAFTPNSTNQNPLNPSNLVLNVCPWAHTRKTLIDIAESSLLECSPFILLVWASTVMHLITTYIRYPYVYTVIAFTNEFKTTNPFSVYGTICLQFEHRQNAENLTLIRSKESPESDRCTM